MFYGDLYGTREFRKEMKNEVNGQDDSFPIQPVAPCSSLKTLLKARELYCCGEQKDYFEEKNCIAWSRGDHMVVVMSNGKENEISIEFGAPGQVFIDLLGNDTRPVVIDKDGIGRFRTRGNSVSVWVPK